MKTINTLAILLTFVSFTFAQANTTASVETNTLKTTNVHEVAATSAQQSAANTESAIAQLKSALIKNIEFSDEMVSYGKEGTVMVEFKISKQGKVEKSKITKALHPLFDNAVSTSAKQIKRIELNGDRYVGIPNVQVPVVFTITE
jgi:TonB family protein